MDILISGASVAGPTAAYWLAKAGHRVTVLERGDRLRTAGQNVDVRGPGREVLRRMGLEETILAQGTGEVGLRFVDDDGGALAEFPAGDDDSGGATAQVEILRGTLASTFGELSSASSLSDAADGYERYMRPLVDAAQKLPPGAPRLAHPRSAVAVSVMRGLIRVAGSRPARALADRFNSSESDPGELPTYRTLAS